VSRVIVPDMCSGEQLQQLLAMRSLLQGFCAGTKPSRSTFIECKCCNFVWGTKSDQGRAAVASAAAGRHFCRFLHSSTEANAMSSVRGSVTNETQWRRGELLRRLQALGGALQSFCAGFEGVQDYAAVRGLRLWHQEYAAIVRRATDFASFHLEDVCRSTVGDAWAAVSGLHL